MRLGRAVEQGGIAGSSMTECQAALRAHPLLAAKGAPPHPHPSCLPCPFQPLSALAIGGIVALKALGYLVFRGANSQKDLFRRDPSHPRVRGGGGGSGVGLTGGGAARVSAPARLANASLVRLEVEILPGLYAETTCAQCLSACVHPPRQVASLRTLPTERGTRLIISGWWGIARHINYTGDWLMGCAAAGACAERG